MSTVALVADEPAEPRLAVVPVKLTVLMVLLPGTM